MSESAWEKAFREHREAKAASRYRLRRPLLKRIEELEAHVAAIEAQRDAAVDACCGLLAGTDGYWETLPEGVAAILAAQAVIAGEPSEG